MKDGEGKEKKKVKRKKLLKLEEGRIIIFKLV